MAEYIDREEALKLLNRNSITKHITFADDVSIYDTIKNIPAADVVEVVHGEWVQTKEPMGFYEVDCVECSACRESWVFEEDFSLDEYIEFWHYCPNCGAKMDGKGG